MRRGHGSGRRSISSTTDLWQFGGITSAEFSKRGRPNNNLAIVGGVFTELHRQDKHSVLFMTSADEYRKIGICAVKAYTIEGFDPGSE